MKCQKCAKTAIVHLTEIISPGPDTSKPKKAVEFHLCVDHAVAAGLLTPVAEAPIAAPAPAPKVTHVPAKPVEKAIVPASSSVFTAKETTTEVHPSCPECGMSWAQFKQTGIVGCPHDYEFFSTRLLPLLQRAQEGAIEHVGKFPKRASSAETDRKVAAHRLQRELKKALEVEDYKRAALLRDQLRGMEIR
jgi:protein arginine kinase activator